MKQQAIPSSFFMSLVEFLVSAKHQVMAISSEFGLTSMQAMTLLLTDNGKPRSMSNLCKIYGCDASNITGIVDGLEQKQLVSRQSHPNDRRIKIIKLEPKGAQLKTKILQATAASSGFLFDPLNQSETEQLIDIIEKLAKANLSNKLSAVATL